MPTYDYKCEQCDHEFEVRQKISDEPLKECEKDDCDGTVKKIFKTASAFQLKGTGWAVGNRGKV